MTQIECDTPIEVNEKMYALLMHKFSGIVAGQILDGKYYIKVWMPRYIDKIKKFINENNSSR